MLSAEVYEQIFRKYYSGLVHFALYHLHDPVMAEEVVQEVFIKIWEKADTFNSDTVWKSYLYRAVKNRCMNSIRDQKSNIDLEEILDMESLEENPHLRLETQDFEQKVNWVIEKLPERCRMVFLLRKREGMTNKEVADLMGISEKTAENQMTNAIRTLTFYLKNKS